MILESRLQFLQDVARVERIATLGLGSFSRTDVYIVIVLVLVVVLEFRNRKDRARG